jgi:hypothetical protein
MSYTSADRGTLSGDFAPKCAGARATLGRSFENGLPLEAMAHLNGIMLNWSLALGTWAVAGALWGVIVFLAIALVRVSIDAQALYRDNVELKRRLVHATGFDFSDEAAAESDAPPRSGTRATQGDVLDRAARA